MTADSVPLLELRDLVINFHTYDGTARVLNGVNLNVYPGERVGLVGETGCGKSVTVRAIMGLLQSPPAEIASGEIVFDEADLLTLSPRQRKEASRGMAMIFQQPMSSLNPVFTIGDQMRAVLQARPKASAASRAQTRSLCTDALRKVQLPDPERVMHSYPFQLSGGMQQRVLIALALLQEPKLLIADEPGTALDVTVQAEILSLLDELVQRENLAVLHITHNLGVARETTDRIYVMYAGSIVEEAITMQLFDRAMHPYTLGLLNSVPRLTGRGVGEGIPGTLPDYTKAPEGCRFHPRCPLADDACLQPPPFVTVDIGHGVACHHCDKIERAVYGKHGA